MFPVCIEDDFLLFSFVFLLLWGICLHCFRWVCQYDGGFKHSVIPPTHSHCKGMIWAPTDSTVANVEDFPLHPSNTAIHSWSLCLCFWQHCGTLMGREAGARPFLPRWYSDFATGLTGCYTGGSEHHGYHSEQANSGLWALWEYCRLCSVFKHYTQLLYTIWADSYCPIANFCDKTGQIVILEVTFDGHWYTGLW